MNISSRLEKEVTLANDGELALYFVGTGSAFAKTLNQNNILIVKGDDHVLVDCGTKCTQALFDAGVAIGDIRNFLITHSHADHIGGLEEVMLYNRYVSKQKPSIVITEAYQKVLWEQSLRGGSEMSESKGLTFEDLWNIIRPRPLVDCPRETWEANIGSINLKMPRTKHYPDDAKSWRDCQWSCGLIVDDKILFTADTRFDPELLESFDTLFNFDYIFHDCQMFTGGVHASIHELETLPARLRSRIVLMHYGDNWRDHVEQAKRACFHSWAKEGHTYTFTDTA